MKYTIAVASLLAVAFATEPAAYEPPSYPSGGDSWGTSTIEVTVTVQASECAAGTSAAPVAPAYTAPPAPAYTAPPVYSAPPAAPTGWGSAPAPPAPYSAPAPPPQYSAPPAPAASGWGSAPAPYPVPGSAPPAPAGTGWPAGAPSGTGAPVPQSSWVPPTGSASGLQAFGLLASVGAVAAFFL